MNTREPSFDEPRKLASKLPFPPAGPVDSSVVVLPER
jgi:hypothetical protein